MTHTNTREEELRKLIQDVLITVEYDFREAHAEILKAILSLIQSERQSLLQELEGRATILTLRDHGGNNREEIEVVPLSVIKSFKGGK